MLLKLLDVLKTEKTHRGFFKGIVVDNVDPQKLKRVKVKIPKKFETDDNSKLPWCFPQNAYGLGGRPDLSSFIIPEINSELTIEFPFEDLYTPVYSGYYQNTTTTQTELADSDYPEVYGFVDSLVQWFRVNKKESKESIEWFRHLDGNDDNWKNEVFRVDAEGNFWINIPKDLYIRINNDFHIEVINDIVGKILNNSNIRIVNDSNTQVKNNYNLKIENKRSIQTLNDQSVTVGGDSEIDVGGTHGTVASLITDQAGSIHHNDGIVLGLSPGEVPSGVDSELDSRITDLEDYMDQLKDKLEELKAIAKNVKTHRDSVKSDLENKANALKGD